MSAVLYSTGCTQCRILKEKLVEKGVDFEEVSSVDEMLGLGITVVPVLKIDNELLDFNAAVKWVLER